MIRPLTPDEADALSAPEVQRQVSRINDYLTRGGREIVVPDALGETIADVYRSAGWDVAITTRIIGSCILRLSRASTHDPAVVGAVLLGTDARTT